jgi:cytochrome c biogenesis protein CcmG, thiol:disulfide interchange protein DsbE
MRRLWIWLPLAMFFAFFGVVAHGLMNPTTSTITSKMIGKPAPRFSLPSAAPGIEGLGSANLTDGKPKLLNIFASWCIPCIAEAPILEQMARQGVDIEGIAIRDRPQDLTRFLTRNGNPYARIGADIDSKVQMSFGSSGVPETFVIDGKGIIRHQHIGDIRAEDVPDIMAALRAAR